MKKDNWAIIIVLEDGSDFVGDYASSLKRARLGAASPWRVWETLLFGAHTSPLLLTKSSLLSVRN